MQRGQETQSFAPNAPLGLGSGNESRRTGIEYFRAAILVGVLTD